MTTQQPSTSTPDVTLRPVEDADLPVFFTQQLDPDANWMAGFTGEDPNDRAAFDAHWAKIRANPEVTTRTIVCDGQPAGWIARFVMFNQTQVGYWIGREFWGRGVATRALAAFLRDVISERPIYGRAAADNAASRRVLEKCGFRLVSTEHGFATARKAEIDEVVMVLDG